MKGLPINVKHFRSKIYIILRREEKAQYTRNEVDKNNSQNNSQSTGNKDTAQCLFSKGNILFFEFYKGTQYPSAFYALWFVPVFFYYSYGVACGHHYAVHPLALVALPYPLYPRLFARGRVQTRKIL